MLDSRFLLITQHAVSRFVQRHAPHLSETAAREHLIQAAATAAHLKEKTILGQDQWQIENPHCVLVMKKDRHDKRIMVCLTVLPEPEQSDPDLRDAMVAKRGSRRF